jgi:uncharacterized protein YqgC (DUF456 family)
MVDWITLLALALLVGGVVGTVVPLVPEGLLSLAGVYLYWWGSGFSDPGIVTLVALTLLGLLAVVVELFGGALGARAGGASWTMSLIAVVVGMALFFLTGPVGLLVGIFVTVVALEYDAGSDTRTSLRSGAVATVGIFASTAVQILLTGTILCVFLVSVFLL